MPWLTELPGPSHEAKRNPSWGQKQNILNDLKEKVTRTNFKPSESSKGNPQPPLWRLVCVLAKPRQLGRKQLKGEDWPDSWALLSGLLGTSSPLKSTQPRFQDSYCARPRLSGILQARVISLSLKPSSHGFPGPYRTPGHVHIPD